MFKKIKILDLFLLLFIILISLSYCTPFFKSGYFETHDGLWAIVRLSEMVRELKDGQIPPRWSDFLNHGYGYPLFSFTYPLPYYIGSIFKLAGFSSVITVKILFVLSVILSGIFMYLLIKNLSGRVAGLISAIFYITAPYRLTDLYIRGSLGESLSLSLFPLIFYLTVIYYKRPGILLSLLLAFSLAAMFLIHNVMALLFIPVWILFAAFLILRLQGVKRKIYLKRFLLIFIHGLTLSAFFIFPALLEKKYLYLSQVSLADKGNYFLTLQELFSMLTWPLISAIFLSLFSFFIVGKKSEILNKQIFIFCLLFFLITLILTQKFSNLIWNFPLLKMVDFPWRIMSLVIFFSSIIISLMLKVRKTLYLTILLVCISFFSNISFIPQLNYFNKDDSYFFTNDSTTTSKDELMPIWVKLKPENRYNEKVEIAQGRAEISNLRYNSKEISFNLNADSAGIARINTIYFPGWNFKKDRQKLSINTNNPYGIMTFSFESGKSTVTGKFKETNVRLISDLLSILGLLFIFYSLSYAGKM